MPKAAKKDASATTSPPPVPASIRHPFPELMSPQLATLATTPPAAGTWSYGIKFDGYRILARLQDGQARLFTRNGNDWTDKLKGLAGELERLPVGDAWLDGEVVVLDDKGVPSFNALQNAFDRSREQSVVYFVFDVMYLDDEDLRQQPQSARTAALHRLLDANMTERIRISEPFFDDGAAALRSACALGLEGLIAKRLDAPYVATRSRAWLKLKCTLRQEFVVGGFIERAGASREIGSLLLGVYDEHGHLISAGSVGTGWNAATARSLRELLAVIETKVSPFTRPTTKGRWSRRGPDKERWVEPHVVVEVSFAEWTSDGSVRHASFKGVRVDKNPKSIVREA